MTSNFLHGDSTTSFIAITLIELPSAVVLILLMDIWGRKPLMVKIEKLCSTFWKSAIFTHISRPKVAALVLPGASCIAAAVLEKVSNSIATKRAT